MKLVHSEDPILFTPSLPVVGFGGVWAKFVDKLSQVMIESGGIGISAVQVGHPIQILLLRTDLNNPIEVFFNPKILDHSRKTITLNEGCLSFPGENYDVERPSQVTVSTIDWTTGKRKKRRLSGVKARIFLHEFEHLQGKTFHR